MDSWREVSLHKTNEAEIKKRGKGRSAGIGGRGKEGAQELEEGERRPGVGWGHLRNSWISLSRRIAKISSVSPLQAISPPLIVFPPRRCSPSVIL
jgi:hypothetical protein